MRPHKFPCSHHNHPMKKSSSTYTLSTRERERERKDGGRKRQGLRRPQKNSNCTGEKELYMNAVGCKIHCKIHAHNEMYIIHVGILVQRISSSVFNKATTDY